MQLLVGSGVIASTDPFSGSFRAKEGVPWTEGLGTRGKAPHDPCLLKLWAYIHLDAGGVSG
jgi:hypothetical protein